MSKPGKLKAAPKEANTIKMGSIIGPEFQMAFGVLLNANLSVKASHQVLLTADQVRAHQKRYEDLRMGLLTRFTTKDAEGKMAMNESKTEYLMADRKGFDAEYVQLLDIDLEVAKVPLSYVEDVKLSPNMLQVLMKTVLQA